MPEGPEVTIITEGLNKKLKGTQLLEFNILSGSRYKKKAPNNYLHFMNLFNNNIDDKSNNKSNNKKSNDKNSNDKNIGIKIININCKGKFIYWEFENNVFMFNTLGMSGVWSRTKEKHSSIEIIYKTSIHKKKIYFVDQRHFGTIKFVFTKKELNDKLKTIGPDILNDKDMSLDLFNKIIKKHPPKNITSVLMNQKIISGIGNYLKSESLYHAKISPFRTVESLSEEEINNLYQSCRLKIIGSYNLGGVSVRHFKDVDDKKGQYTFRLEVYGKKQDKLGNKLNHDITPDKRYTYWTPNVQK